MKIKLDLNAEEVYELDCCENQIRLELFKIIQNNFSINKCENCGRLFIPITTSRNPNQKGRNDQKYCNNLYQDTGKTCREIGALNKRKEKVQKSPILQEYNREYKRMYGLHYNHPKRFKETKFIEWSKKAQKLRDRYSDEQIYSTYPILGMSIYSHSFSTTISASSGSGYSGSGSGGGGGGGGGAGAF